MVEAAKKKKSARKAPAGDDRVSVIDAEGHRRPFMRGIMVHSLMTRGVDFDDAYGVADRVRRSLRGRVEVPQPELAERVGEILAKGGLGDRQRAIPLTDPIQIGEGGRSIPFSKGVLSQSLLAASIDPTDAFEVARDIELTLHQRGAARISRRALRKLSYEKLLARFGAQTAERYLVWRKHQDPDKPVILLIGGSTGVGKTSIALEVALRLGIRRVLSTDSIRHVMRIMLSAELAPALHASSFDAHRVLRVDPAGESRVVDGYLQQASAVSVGVRAMIERAIEENTSLVLDGVALVPGLIDLDAYAKDARVIFLIVGRLDEMAFRSHFAARGSDRSRRGTKRYLQNFDAILEIQNYLIELADQHGVPIVDNLAVESSVPLVIRHVVETLRKEGGVSTPELPYAKR